MMYILCIFYQDPDILREGEKNVTLFTRAQSVKFTRDDDDDDDDDIVISHR